MRICYFGTYRADYARNQILIEGLRRNGVEVVECHAVLWRDIEDRVQAVTGKWHSPAFWERVVRAYMQALRAYWQLHGRYDVLMVGYPGQFDVYVARILAWLHRKPLGWDIFMSIYLIAVERGLEQRSPFAVRGIRLLERMACGLPDLLLLDTEEYVDWFGRTHGTHKAQFRLVPTGADDRVFSPVANLAAPKVAGDGNMFQVVYYGSYIRNHGVPTIVEAAKLLVESPAIQFMLIGDGPEREGVAAFVKRNGLSNVVLSDWLDPEALRRKIAGADLCLGVFGVTPQSLMTVQNKIYEGLAMAKPVLTGDGPAVRKAFTHATHLFLCERNDPVALAQAVEILYRDEALRTRIAENGYRAYQERYTVQKLGHLCKRHLQERFFCAGEGTSQYEATYSE